MVLSRLSRREITGRVSRGEIPGKTTTRWIKSVARISSYEGSRSPKVLEGIRLFPRRGRELHPGHRTYVSPSSKVPCARGGRGGAGVRCTLTMEHHDLCGVMMIEGGPRLIPELGRRRVYHRDGFPSSIPRRRRRPRFRAAPISARQHLIHTATTLSHPQFYSSWSRNFSRREFFFEKRAKKNGSFFPPP